MTLPGGDAVGAGDTVTLTAPGVVNPAAGTISDLSVVDSTDTEATTAAAYSIGVNGLPGSWSPPTRPRRAPRRRTRSPMCTPAAPSRPQLQVTSIHANRPGGDAAATASSYYVITDTTTTSGSRTR